jgi:hypothetical protein
VERLFFIMTLNYKNFLLPGAEAFISSSPIVADPLHKGPRGLVLGLMGTGEVDRMREHVVAGHGLEYFNYCVAKQDHEPQRAEALLELLIIVHKLELYRQQSLWHKIRSSRIEQSENGRTVPVVNNVAYCYPRNQNLPYVKQKAINHPSQIPSFPYQIYFSRNVHLKTVSVTN